MSRSGEYVPYRGTRIMAPSTFAGVAGQAWRLQLPEAGKRERPDHDGCVGAFIVRVPGAHPFWNHWSAAMVHLRPIDGVKPPVIRMPGATHEFMIQALNPESPLPALPDSLEIGPDLKLYHLRPIDVVEQFAAANDIVADHILELAMRAIVDGIASPDQDWRDWWKHVIAQTAAHYGDGTHSLPRPS
jgi:hypothetical protein